MLRASIPLWFGMCALAALAATGAYAVVIYPRSELLRNLVEAASDVVASSFEIERGVQDSLAGSRASTDQVAFAHARLERAFGVIDSSNVPRFVAESHWMRMQQSSAMRLQEILEERGDPKRTGILIGRLRVSLSELSDTAVMLHRMAHQARARTVRHMFIIEFVMIGLALTTMASLIALYQRHVRHRAAAEASLLRANEALRRHADEKDQFLYAASHDLKEPLRMVTMYSDLVQKDLGRGISPEMRRHFDYVYDGARRMQRLLDDLFEITSAEHVANVAESVDVNAEVQSVAALFADSLRAANGTLRCDRMPTVRCSRARIAQLFQNLIGNAIKYRHPGRRLEIAIQATRDAKQTIIGVRDNGQGIPREYYDEVFRLFRRLHGAEIEGTGAGLAICKRIVESWDGRIWVESEVGIGSTFFFTVPNADDSAGS